MEGTPTNGHMLPLRRSVSVPYLQMLEQQLAEVGSPEGHLRQDALVTRLAVAVAAPWAQLPASPAPGGPVLMAIDGGAQLAAGSVGEQQYAAASAQVDTIVKYAWHVLVHTGVAAERMLDVK